MAKAKKRTKKPSKTKTVTKTAAKKTSARRPALTSEARQRLLKPRTGWDDAIESVISLWTAHRGLRVGGLTAPRLSSLLAKARKARAKEETLVAKQAEQLAPVRDGRMMADDAAWRALLDFHATVKFLARRQPEVAGKFAFLAELLRNERSQPDPAPTA